MRTEVQVMRTEADGSVRRRNCQEKMRAHLSKDINTGRAFSPHLPPGLVRLNSLPSDTKLYGRSLRGFQSWGDFQIGFEWSCAVWLVMLWCHGECWEFRTFPVSILNLDQASLSIARYWQQLMGSIPGWETKIPHAVGCSCPPTPKKQKQKPIKRKTMFPEVQHRRSVTFRFQMMDGGVCRPDHLVKESQLFLRPWVYIKETEFGVLFVLCLFL